jgi:hypothetical protein
MSAWVEFNSTSYSLLLTMGYSHFVFEGDGEDSKIYPYKNKEKALKHLQKKGFDTFDYNHYIMEDGEVLRDLANGIDLLYVNVLI